SILEEAGLVEFDAAKAIYGLATAGFIQRIGTSARFAGGVAAGQGNTGSDHRARGAAYLKTGALDDAAREFRRVLELEPDDVEARSCLGGILARKGDW